VIRTPPTFGANHTCPVKRTPHQRLSRDVIVFRLFCRNVPMFARGSRGRNAFNFSRVEKLENGLKEAECFQERHSLLFGYARAL
jgi:hypothetical protein